MLFIDGVFPNRSPRATYVLHDRHSSLPYYLARVRTVLAQNLYQNASVLKVLIIHASCYHIIKSSRL